MGTRAHRLFHSTGLAIVIAVGFLLFPGDAEKAEGGQGGEAPATDIAKLGVQYKSYRPLEQNYTETTLDDGRNIIVRVLTDTLFGGGGYFRSSGADGLAELTLANGALAPREVLSMAERLGSDGGQPPKASPHESVDVQRLPFDEADFKGLLSAPGELLFPDKPKESARIIMFIWSECATCEKMREYFLTNRDSMDFQVLFVPIAGNRTLDMSALSFLGLTDAVDAEKQFALQRLQEATDALGARVGKILVPAFAWLDVQGNARIGNLTAATFQEITVVLNGGKPLP